MSVWQNETISFFAASSPHFLIGFFTVGTQKPFNFPPIVVMILWWRPQILKSHHWCHGSSSLPYFPVTLYIIMCLLRFQLHCYKQITAPLLLLGECLFIALKGERTAPSRETAVLFLKLYNKYDDRGSDMQTFLTKIK